MPANATMSQSSDVTCHVLPSSVTDEPQRTRLRRARAGARAGRGRRLRARGDRGRRSRRLTAHERARRAVRRARGRAATTRRCTRQLDAATRSARSRSADFASAYRAGAARPRPRRGLRLDRPARTRAPAAPVSRCRSASDTRLFGTLRADVHAARRRARGHGPRGRLVALAGVSRAAPGRAAHRARPTLPRRATLLARDGSVLAEAPPAPAGGGRRRSSPLGEAAARCVGDASARSPPRAAGRWKPRACPPTRSSGSAASSWRSTTACAARPAASCWPGSACSPRARRAPAAPVRTTISPALQQAAVAALGGQFGGIVALRARQRADPGGRRHRPRRPAAARARPSRWSPSPACCTAASPPAHGVPLRHLRDARRRQAQQRQRRGMRRHAGTGVRGVLQLGVRAARRQARRRAARRDAPNASASTTDRRSRARPRARSRRPAQIQGELDVGSTAIGQGRCWRRRCRWRPSPRRSPTAGAARADVPAGPRPPPRGAARMQRVGRAHGAPADDRRRRARAPAPPAAIPGVDGRRQDRHRRTEDAPARPRRAPDGNRLRERTEPEKLRGSESEASNTDAWFAAFAPALHPRIAVCVLLVKDGAGGATAAPVAREVLEAGPAGDGDARRRARR